MLHSKHTMTRQMAEALRQQALAGSSTPIAEEEEEESEADTDEDEWLAEEDGRLLVAKSTFKISQLHHEA
jgi:hypothetical protein